MTDALKSELADQIAKKRALVVVGTGVSLASTGGNALASWRGLIANGVKRCLDRGICSSEQATTYNALLNSDLNDLLIVANQVSTRLGWTRTREEPCDREWNKWLRATVGALHAEQPELIQAIRDLGVPIATLNYDGLLTKVTGRKPITWMDADRWLPVLRGEDEAILHLHGHWDEPHSVVLGISSYEALIGKKLAQHLQQALATFHSLVFIGCSGTMGDPNFSKLIDWMSDLLRGTEHNHYLLLPESEDLPLAHCILNNAGILPLRYGPSHTALLPYLQAVLPSPRPIMPTQSPPSATPRLPPSLLLLLVDLIAKTPLRERNKRDSLAQYHFHFFRTHITHRDTNAEGDLLRIITDYHASDHSLRYLLDAARALLTDTTFCLIQATLQDLFLIDALCITLGGLTIPRDALKRHYIASCPGSQAYPTDQPLERALLTLCEMQNRRPGMLRPFFEFIMRLHQDTDSPQLDTLLSAHNTMAEVDATAAFLDHETAIPFSYLIIDIPPSDLDAPDAIDYWQYGCDNAFVARYSAPWDGTRDSLLPALENIVISAREWSVDLIIEIFVPHELLGLALSSLRIDPVGEPWRVEEMHPIHLRWRERACGTANTAIKSWKFIAQRIQQTNNGVSTCWLSEHSTTGPRLIHDLRAGALGNCLGFMFRPFQRVDDTPHTLLRSALIGGMAFGVWSRADKSDWRLFKDAVSAIIDGSSVGDASKQLRAAYMDGFQEPVTLFWDDPARNPLEDQLEPLGRRGIK